MHGQPTNRPQYSVKCPCGAALALDARAFGRPRTCRACGVAVTVAWGRDPRSNKSVPVIVNRGGKYVGPAGEKPLQTAYCECGFSEKVMPGRIPPCPKCHKRMKLRGGEAPAGMKIQRSEGLKPSAPVIPIQMRAPLRTRIKVGAQFFDCACGERVLLRGGSGGKSMQCPACERLHLIEESAAPPPEPPRRPDQPLPIAGASWAVSHPGAARAAAPAPPSAPAAPARELRLGEFACRCGEIQPPRTSRTGRNFECKVCGRKGHVEQERNPQTQAMTMKPVFTFEPAGAGGVRAPAASSRPLKGPGGGSAPAWSCACGRAIEAHLVLASNEIRCPDCGRKIRLEKWKHPHSTMTMIRPVFGDPAGTPAGTESTVSFEELSEPVFAVSGDGKDSAIFELPAEEEDDGAPPEIPADSQQGLCECGTELLINRGMVGRTVQCPVCTVLITVDESKDPRTGALRLQVRSVGQMSAGEWIIDE